MDELIRSSKPKDADYFLFMGANEKIVYETQGVLNNRVNGYLVLTDKKLFFYFISNISRDKIFIATYPYIVSAELKEGLLSSALIIKNKKESFMINRINKKEAEELSQILKKIIEENKDS
ncbi:MAG: hypothetical protein FJW69_07345 [Actinobacteria bacterium]|nr:hypothetical protein [Actinomycetota bacterium]